MVENYFDTILSYLFSPMGLLIIGLIFGLIIVLKYFQKKGDKTFKTQKLEQTIKTDFKDYINLVGITQKNRYLRYSGFIIGKIIKIGKINFWFYKEDNPRAEAIFKNKEIKTDEKFNELKEKQIIEPYLFYEVMTRGIGLLPAIISFFGFGRTFFLIDSIFLNEPEKNQDFIIKDSTQFWNLAGIRIFSGKGKEFISDLAFKKVYEQIVQGEIEFIPKMTYLELRTAKVAEKAKLFAKIEGEKYKKQLEEFSEEEPEE